MYVVIRYNFINQKYNMDILNLTENIHTAVNIAYRQAKNYYDNVVNIQEDRIMCTFFIVFSENDKNDGYHFAVMKLPEKENFEDEQYKYSKKEIFGERIDSKN